MYLLGLPSLVIFALFGLVACSEPPEPTVNLYRAVEVGDLDQVKRHLFWDTDIDQPDDRGDLPLHIAARLGRLTIARELVEHGANIEATDATGRTPLETALVAGRTQLAEMLIAQGATFDVQAMLFTLVRQGVSDRDVIEFLAERGADLNARDEAGLTPLHRAVAAGRLELATRLIRAGVDVNRRDAQGRAPLSIALETRNRNIIELLRQNGALANGAGRSGSRSPTSPTDEDAG